MGKAAEVNDDLAAKFGAEDLNALKAQITERLEAEYTGAARAVTKRALLDKLDDAEMTQAIMTQARQYPGQERQFFEFIQQNAQMQQQLRAPLFEDKVVDYIFELANMSDREVSKDDLQAAVEALDEE